MKEQIKAVAVATGLTLCASAHAEMELVLPDPAPETKSARTGLHAQSAKTNRILTIGHEIPAITKSFASRLPVHIAMDMLIPSGWSVELPRYLMNDDSLMSWTGGQHWIHALNEALISTDLPIYALVNWDARTILIGASRVETAEGQHQWVAVAGESLKTILALWGFNQRWQSSWEIDRHIYIDSSSTFRSPNFGGAVDLLITSVQGARDVVKASMYHGNQVVRITNRQEVIR